MITILRGSILPWRSSWGWRIKLNLNLNSLIPLAPLAAAANVVLQAVLESDAVMQRIFRRLPWG